MAVEITSEQELEAWLEGKPREWAQIIALRAAMRVLPIAIDPNNWANPRGIERLALTLLRALAAASIALEFPQKDKTSRASARAASAVRTASEAIEGNIEDVAEAILAAVRSSFDSDEIYRRDDQSSYFASATAREVSLVDSRALSYDFSGGGTAPWRMIESDCQMLIDGHGIEGLVHHRLWPHSGEPDWWTKSWIAMTRWLSASGDGFEIWREWYFGRTEGLPHAFAGFDDAADDAFYRWIVEHDNEWWSRAPTDVNAQITQFVDALRAPKRQAEEPVDFFISHAKGDTAALTDLLSVLDDMGKSYIIPVRDGSEERSDKAIERAERVIALYSQSYVQSDQCEQEWLHSYYLDVSTAEQRMIAFRLDRADLKPLMNPLSFCDLTRLLPDRRKQAMAKWIEWKPRTLNRENVEQTLTTHLDPGVVASMDGKLDTARDPILNAAELPSELAAAMDVLRMMLDLSRQSERNLPSMMQGSLRLYDDHFTENGRASSWRGLGRYINVLAQGTADLPAATMREEKAALEQLIAAHGECIDALASADEQNRELANVPVASADPAAIESLIDKLKDLRSHAQNQGASTENYDKEAGNLVRQGREFAFEAGAPDADRKPDAARKGFLRYVGGFGIKTLTVLGSLATLRSTPEYKRLVEAAEKLVEEFYKMVGL